MHFTIKYCALYFKKETGTNVYRTNKKEKNVWFT